MTASAALRDLDLTNVLVSRRTAIRPGSCYWATVAFNSSTDAACVFASTAFAMSPARAGTQTHLSFMDLLRLTPCRGCEPMATIVIKATVNRAKRLMGFIGCPLMNDTKAVSS